MLSIFFAVLYFFLFRKKYGASLDDSIINEGTVDKNI
jgi:hypothetical protein